MKLEWFEVVLSAKLEPHSSDSKQITPALLQCIETKLPLSIAYPLFSTQVHNRISAAASQGSKEV